MMWLLAIGGTLVIVGGIVLFDIARDGIRASRALRKAREAAWRGLSK